VYIKKPNPQPLPYEGRGVRIKASFLVGESDQTVSHLIEKGYISYLEFKF
jgi:hypothetical protein